MTHDIPLGVGTATVPMTFSEGGRSKRNLILQFKDIAVLAGEDEAREDLLRHPARNLPENSHQAIFGDLTVKAGGPETGGQIRAGNAGLRPTAARCGQFSVSTPSGLTRPTAIGQSIRGAYLA